MMALKGKKNINLLELSDSEKISFLKEVRTNFQLKIEEAKFWRSLAESKRVIINGLSVDF